MMKFSRHTVPFFACCMLLSGIFFLQNVQAAGATFTRPLKVGVTGEDVRELQKILNTDPSTHVQEVGPGSPGQETAYFGPKTQAAVVKFQEKYRNEILVPNGLSAGTGYVGPATLSFLNNLAQELSPVARQPIPNLVPPVVPQQTATVTNPNEKNLDIFLAAIDSVGKKKGVTTDTLNLIKKQVAIDIATSTDLRQKFIDSFQGVISKAPQPVQGVFSKVAVAIKGVFKPKPALAQFSGGGGDFGGGGAGGSWGSSGSSAGASGASQCVPSGSTDFGGALVFSFFCTCSANWLLTITPGPPTFPVLLTYQPGSQMCMAYNIPITTWLLGKYNPGAGNCSIYVGTGCATIPSEGMISPFVGSSSI